MLTLSPPSLPISLSLSLSLSAGAVFKAVLKAIPIEKLLRIVDNHVQQTSGAPCPTMIVELGQFVVEMLKTRQMQCALLGAQASQTGEFVTQV